MNMDRFWLVRYLKILLRARPIRSPDRLFFERVVIPAMGIFQVQRVLFVGVAPYTWHYNRLFRQAGIELFTIDRRPEAAVWGVCGRHIVGDIAQAEKNIPKTKFDVIVLMGIIGYGVNDVSQVKAMLESAASILMPHGRVLVACEERFGLDPVAISANERINLAHSASYCFPASVKLPNFDYGFHFLAAHGVSIQ